jgi:hypothetical protein
MSEKCRDTLFVRANAPMDKGYYHLSVKLSLSHSFPDWPRFNLGGFAGALMPIEQDNP